MDDLDKIKKDYDKEVVETNAWIAWIKDVDHDIIKLSAPERKALAVAAKNKLDEVKKRLDKDIKDLDDQDKKLQEKLEDTAQKTVDAEKTLADSQAKLKTMNAHLKEVDKEYEEHLKIFNESADEMDKQEQAKIDAWNKRMNALTPYFCSFFIGIFTGHPERMIPGYDQAASIYSFCAQDYENAQLKLDDAKERLFKYQREMTEDEQEHHGEMVKIEMTQHTIRKMKTKKEKLTALQGVYAHMKTGVSERHVAVSTLCDTCGNLNDDAQLSTDKADVKKIFEKKMGNVLKEMTDVIHGIEKDHKTDYEQKHHLATYLIEHVDVK